MDENKIVGTDVPTEGQDVLRENSVSVFNRVKFMRTAPAMLWLLEEKTTFKGASNSTQTTDALVEREVSPALLNDVVLDTIFGYLTHPELKRCRLVCSKWNEVSTVTLVKRRTCLSNATLNRQSVYPGTGNRGIRNDENRVPAEGTLSPPLILPLSSRVALNFLELSECLDNSSKFPCVGINLNNVTWRLSHLSVKNFLRNHGMTIRYLKLNFNFQRTKTFMNLLRLLPNLEEMTIEHIGNFARDGVREQIFGKPGQPLQIPSLKIISLYAANVNRAFPLDDLRKRALGEIIVSAKNLERINNFHPALTEAVVRANKMRTISSLRFQTFTALVDSDGWKKFAQAKPKLRRLEILEVPGSSDRDVQCASNALTDILNSSKDDLEFLRMNPLLLLDSIRIPVLSNLSNLEVAFNVNLSRRFGWQPVEQHLNFFGIFPGHVNLSEVFPRLKKVRLEQTDYLNRNGPFVFPLCSNGTSIPSVEVLEYSCNLDMVGVSTLSRYFPNITHLVIDWRACVSPGNHREIWNVPFRLKKLELNGVSFLWDRGLLPGNAMDSFFTGIPEGICQNIKSNSGTFLISNPSVLRSEPSIVRLKGLQELIIRFSFDGLLGIRLLGRCPLITKVTGLFAFRMMPDLKVLIQYDYHHPMAAEMVAALDPLSPYVTFSHSSLN